MVNPFYVAIRRFLLLIVAAVLITACEKNNEGDTTTPPPPLSGTPTLVSKTLLSNQGIIWGFDVLPNGAILFTQKQGSLQLYDTLSGSLTPITGLPTNIQAAGQGGLLDLTVSPDFATNRQVFVAYSSTGGFLNLARFTLSGSTATNWTILLTTETASTWSGHYGSRIRFGRDGKLYWAVGEGGGGSLGGTSSPHQNGQRLNTLWGKIHRLNPEGSVPADNPIMPGQSTRTSIFSFGHRNPQGLAVQPGTGNLFSTEHGPNGGCELNAISAAANYGWPLFSTGNNYNGTNISNGNHNAPGITAPLKSWTPALAPSGLAFIDHPSWRDWNGNLLAGSLGRRQLLMIAMTNGQPGTETVLLENIGRVRNVRMGPAGKIYVSVEDGRLLELTAR